jgi:SAM-dependent methyltransferase
MKGLLEPVELAGPAAVVASAYEVGLIEYLARPAPAAEHAERLGLDPEATALALEALASLGIAEEREGRFGRSPTTDSISPSPGAELEGGLWGHLPRFLRTGERLAHMDGSPAERAAAYSEIAGQLGPMFEDAAETLATKLPPPGPRILDVGAGSGVWSLAMCERTPAARVTAVDLPDVLPGFLDRAEALGLSRRVDTIAGDFHAVELPANGFDRIVLANVLHLEPPARAKSLIAHVAPALKPGGELVVVDALAEGDPEAERGRSIYALHLAMRTDRGRVHPRAEIERWCRASGLGGGELVVPGVPPRAVAALVHRAP